MENTGRKYIKALRYRWIIASVLSVVFFSAALSLIAISLLTKSADVSLWWAAPLTLLLASVWIFTSGIYKLTPQIVARLLNQSFPQLEESASLALRSEESFNLLERLQFRKIEPEFYSLPTPPVIHRKLKVSTIALAASLVFSFLITHVHFSNRQNVVGDNKALTAPGSNVPPDSMLPEVKMIRLNIKPPAYTGQRARSQDQFSATVEAGSALTWEIETDQPVKSLRFIFNDKQAISLRPSNKSGTTWILNRTVSQSGFYQLRIDSKRSDLYKLETIPDLPAGIKILAPAPYSTIDFGQPPKVALKVRVNDDYGIHDAFISATIAKGKGEGVQFKELHLKFSEVFRGAQQYTLQKDIDLAALGMVPGDELYFYVNARDSRRQESRSDVYTVTIQDTAQLMSMEGMISGVNLVPEFFRSQRQIIIDTEKLLKEKTILSAEVFNNRSNNLGFDQKLLRMRYGKFLGEETDEEIGGGHENTKGAETDPANFGNAEELMDAFAHKHDIAEDATFFEPELKAQLKATLAEMWKSELRLRTYKPGEALPFEYKALRLLKDLQQKSRVYVAKTAFNPPVIAADKRLSGELDKIGQPSSQRNLNLAESRDVFRRSTAVLARLKNGGSLTSSERILLNQTAGKLAASATAQPSLYLETLTSLRRILHSGPSGKIRPDDIHIIEKGLQRLIGQGTKTPQQKGSGPASELTSEYFNNLKGRQ